VCVSRKRLVGVCASVACTEITSVLVGGQLQRLRVCRVCVEEETSRCVCKCGVHVVAFICALNHSYVTRHIHMCAMVRPRIHTSHSVRMRST